MANISLWSSIAILPVPELWLLQGFSLLFHAKDDRFALASAKKYI